MSGLNHVSSVYLPGLGIDELYQQRNPTPNGFPLAFNTSNHGIWDSVVRNLALKDSVAANWEQAINAYIDTCVAQERYPFSNFRQSINDQIGQDLSNRRREVVRFLNRTGILGSLTIRTTQRTIKLHTNGFVLMVSGNVRIKDPTFTKWLTQIPTPGFSMQREGVFRRKISPNTTVVLYNEGGNAPMRWHIGYEITVNKFPVIPNNPTPSKAEIQTFIKDIIWMPILRGNRPKGVHHRLI